MRKQAGSTRQKRWYLKARKEDKRRGLYALLLKRYGPFRNGEHAYEVLRRASRRAPNGYYKLIVGRILQEWLHRAVMMVKLGRGLRRGEEVHHKDGNRANNHPRNLAICADRLEHRIAHGGGYGVHRTAWGSVCYTSGPNEKKSVARVVMELALGRKLRPGERVLHRNGKPGDNRLENLEVIPWSEFIRRCWVTRRKRYGPKGRRGKAATAERGGGAEGVVAG
jgi:hypothetical protein